MSNDTTPREVGLSEGLGPDPERSRSDRWFFASKYAQVKIPAQHEVQIAWDAWQAAVAAERERCASVCSAVAAGLRRDGLRDQALGADDCEANIRLCSGPNVRGKPHPPAGVGLGE